MAQRKGTPYTVTIEVKSLLMGIGFTVGFFYLAHLVS